MHFVFHSKLHQKWSSDFLCVIQAIHACTAVMHSNISCFRTTHDATNGKEISLKFTWANHVERFAFCIFLFEINTIFLLIIIIPRSLNFNPETFLTNKKKVPSDLMVNTKSKYRLGQRMRKN